MSLRLSKPKLPVGGLGVGPNDLDKPAGDFLVAENVVHRRDGILEPLPGENYFMDGFFAAQYGRVFSDWEPDRILKIRKQTADTFGQLFDDINSAWYAAEFQPGETQAVYADGRHILSGAEYVVVAENSLTSSGAPRRAGLPQPAGLKFSTFSSTVGTSLSPTVPANKYVAWTALVRRKITGDRFITSAPCSGGITNSLNANPTNYTLRVFFGDSPSYEVGDEVVVFRTASFDSVAENNVTFYLAVIHALTATDLSNGYADVQDNTLETNLGAELYTNPGAQGSLKTNLIPPRSSGVETFQGTTFYINKHAQPNVVATVVGTIGPLPAGGTDAQKQQRKNSIGSRSFTGDITNTSPDITNVSASDVIGLAIGQEVTWFFGTAGRVVSISGAGPYTVTLDTPFGSTSAAVSFTAYDTLEITGTLNGASRTSKVVRCKDVTSIQEALTTLQDVSSVDMNGFVLNVGALHYPGGIVNDSQVQLSFSVLSPDQWDSFVLKFSNPANWVQGETTTAGFREIESIQETRRNVVWYSKTNLPEDVAPIQFILIGNGTVYRLLNVQSVMLAFCSDGLFKVEGQGDNWIITPLDTSVRLIHPDCAAATGQLGFAWLERGLCAVSETGVQDISKDAIGPLLKDHAVDLYALGDPHALWGPSLVIDRHNSDVWLNIVDLPLGDDVEKFATYIVNTETGKFSTAGNTYTALSYYPTILGLVRAKVTGLFGTGLYRTYFPPTGLPNDYLPATVVYLPLVENAGEVKQWVDVNYFFDDVPETATGVYVVEALFGGELTSSTNMFELNASQAPGNIFALHALVPRRSARDVELVFGFRTSITPDSDHPSGGYYFQFKGASVRVRVASDRIKR